MKVYNGFDGVLAAYPARSSFALFPCRTVHLKKFRLLLRNDYNY